MKNIQWKCINAVGIQVPAWNTSRHFTIILVNRCLKERLMKILRVSHKFIQNYSFEIWRTDFPRLKWFWASAGRVDASEQRARTEPYGLFQWHELLNILKLSSSPTAVIMPTCLYSLAFEVLRSDVVLVRKLGVPPLALDSTPYGADGATVALALSPNTRCGLGCCLCAVHHAILCRPRQEGLFHSLKNGSGCQV